MDTQFSIVMNMTIRAYDRDWTLRATVTTNQDDEPTILFVENLDDHLPGMKFCVPEKVWDEAERLLRTPSEYRAEFNLRFMSAPIPFLAEAAE